MRRFSAHMNVVRNICANSCEQSGLYSMKKHKSVLRILTSIAVDANGVEFTIRVNKFFEK